MKVTVPHSDIQQHTRTQKTHLANRKMEQRASENAAAKASPNSDAHAKHTQNALARLNSANPIERNIAALNSGGKVSYKLERGQSFSKATYTSKRGK